MDAVRVCEDQNRSDTKDNCCEMSQSYREGVWEENENLFGEYAGSGTECIP